MNWFLVRSHQVSHLMEDRDKLVGKGVEVFLPTVFRKIKSGGREVVVERPGMLNFIMIRYEKDELRTLLSDYVYLHAVTLSNRDGSNYRLLTISDAEANMFMQTAGVYRSEVPFYEPDAQMLEKGDYVRVIGGPFEGVEGVLISQQGRDGGKVQVKISKVLAVSTMHIDPEHIQVLRFAPGSHHLYQKLNSLAPRLETSWDCVKNDRPIPLDVFSAIDVFVKRFGCVEVPTLILRARYLSMLYQAYLILRRKEEAEACADSMRKLLPLLRSERYKEMVNETLALQLQS